MGKVRLKGLLMPVLGEKCAGNGNREQGGEKSGKKIAKTSFLDEKTFRHYWFGMEFARESSDRIAKILRENMPSPSEAIKRGPKTR